MFSGSHRFARMRQGHWMPVWLLVAALLIPGLFRTVQAQALAVPPRQASGAVARLDPNLAQAERLIQQGQYTSALTLLEDLAAQPNAPIEVFNDMAVVYARLDRLPLAREMLIKAIEQDPRSAALFDNLNRVNGILARRAYAKALDSDEILAPASAVQPALRLLTLAIPPTRRWMAKASSSAAGVAPIRMSVGA